MSTVAITKVPMTPDIQEFLHAMHDAHTVEAEKQSMRNGTAGHIPFTNMGKPMRKLVHRLNKALIELLGHEDWGYTGLWSTRLPKGGYHVSHTHPKGWMSGICYVDVPSSNGGHLEFEDRVVLPNTGDVVLFPSDTVHGVSVYNDDKPRLTVAFDLLKMEAKRA